ncbi:MAG: TrgA family protein [Amylibacter sp.]|jgi:hypothetical protein|nr:TrgA family protein [Amylibacter sp.]
MPTAAKLVAALALALTGAIAAMIFVQGNSEIPIGIRFVGTNALVGFFAGWYSLGKNPGNSIFDGAMSGIRSLVFLLIGSGMVFAFYHVSRNLQQFKSQDVTSLPLAWIENSFENVVLAMSKDVAIALVIGGMLAGIASYVASRRWV